MAVVSHKDGQLRPDNLSQPSAEKGYRLPAEPGHRRDPWQARSRAWLCSWTPCFLPYSGVYDGTAARLDVDWDSMAGNVPELK